MKIFKMRKSTDGLYDLVKELKKHYEEIVMAEIGSYAGESTEIFCKHEKVKTVYSIDPYIGLYDVNDSSSRSPMDKVEQLFLDVQERYSSKIIKIKETSKNTISLVNDINFVYIDGNHTYDNVKEDLELWCKKLQSGNFIGGHDYHQRRHPGVTIAVDEFCKTNSLQIFKTFKDTSYLIRL